MSKSILNKTKSNGGKGGCCDCCNSKSILNKSDCNCDKPLTKNGPTNISNPLPGGNGSKAPNIFSFQKSSKNGP